MCNTLHLRGSSACVDPLSKGIIQYHCSHRYHAFMKPHRPLHFCQSSPFHVLYLAPSIHCFYAHLLMKSTLMCSSMCSHVHERCAGNSQVVDSSGNPVINCPAGMSSTLCGFLVPGKIPLLVPASPCDLCMHHSAAFLKILPAESCGKRLQSMPHHNFCFIR